MTNSTIPLDKHFDIKSPLKGLLWGIVVDNNDPDKMGGIKVKIPGVFECNETDISALPFVYPLNSTGGTQDNSSIDIPEIGTQVIVEFINNDPHSGHYIASFISKKSFPEIFKDDYPSSLGKTWATSNKLPSWFKINKTQDYVEIFLSPAKTLIHCDKEGRISIKSSNDISLVSDSSINLIAKKNITLTAENIISNSTENTEKSTIKNISSSSLNVESTSTSFNLGAYIKKTISESYTSSSLSLSIPEIVVSGIISAIGAKLTTINETPVQSLFTGQVVYGGSVYVPGSIPPISIVPIDQSKILSSKSTTDFIKELIDSHISEYSLTAELMQAKSNELRSKFKSIAAKLVGSKDYNLRKEETDLSNPLVLAEEYLIASKGVNELSQLKLKLIKAKLDATTSLGNMQSRYATDSVNVHSQLQTGFDSQTNYKDVFQEFDPSVQREVLDKFNLSAPNDLKLTPPNGSTDFASTSPDVFSEWFGSVESSSFLPVINGPIFQLAEFTGFSTWAKTNILTSMTNYKQKNIVPDWTSTAKQSFNDFVLLVRKIEMISCKLYELINLIQRLIEALSNLDIDLNKILEALSYVEAILPTWILDQIKQILDAIQCGDLPQVCYIGSISPEELESLPQDLKSLFGEQNTVVTKIYSYEKQYAALINRVTPATSILQSASEFSKTATPSSGINIIGNI